MKAAYLWIRKSDFRSQKFHSFLRKRYCLCFIYSSISIEYVSLQIKLFILGSTFRWRRNYQKLKIAIGINRHLHGIHIVLRKWVKWESHWNNRRRENLSTSKSLVFFWQWMCFLTKKNFFALNKQIIRTITWRSWEKAKKILFQQHNSRRSTAICWGKPLKCASKLDWI